MAETSKRNIIIRITNDAIWFNNELPIPLEKTNLPVGEFKFVDKRYIYWEAEMVAYKKEEGCLTVRIVNYRPEFIDHFPSQQPKSSIERLIFSEVYWPAFSADLSFYKKTAFQHLLSEYMPQGQLEAKGKIIHLKVQIPFSKARFGTGFVAFDYKFIWERAPIEIKIQNTQIIPEFDYVKSYFSKHFNSRTFEVLIVYSEFGHGHKSVKASSPQIEQIKDVAIETMKFVKMERLKHPPKYIKEIDKSLFTPEDIFDPFDNKMLGTYQMTQKELFEHIMTWENIRNKEQLEYLSGYLHEVSEKIRFTLTPKFGFLFVVHGERMIHYIWEMLNTNATYIWSFDKGFWSQDKQLGKMEEVISYIRNHGRDSYLRNVSPHEEILFRRILHQGAGSQLIDHFPRWRHAINEAIV